ncbi:MAG: hypothetical protein BWK80_30420 [Desulfobacteraceae bacterium IS3]|nr:MAG: hypothetical protein BWK80_30420 [Desulfobacteraceae bacterium IS3]
MGWRAASIPRETDWSDFDVIISNHQASLKKALELGVKSTNYFFPGFPGFISQTLGIRRKVNKLFFSRISGIHFSNTQE